MYMTYGRYIAIYGNSNNAPNNLLLAILTPNETEKYMK